MGPVSSTIRNGRWRPLSRSSGWPRSSDPRFRMMVVLASFTGLRLGDTPGYGPRRHGHGHPPAPRVGRPARWQALYDFRYTTGDHSIGAVGVGVAYGNDPPHPRGVVERLDHDFGLGAARDERHRHRGAMSDRPK
jgi:hypothetical protein